jgi:hypothetical protein
MSATSIKYRYLQSIGSSLSQLQVGQTPGFHQGELTLLLGDSTKGVGRAS